MSLVMMGATSFAATDVGESSTHVLPYRNNTDKADEVGVGVEVGTQSGVNVEYWLTNNRTLEAAVSFDNGNTVFSFSHQWMFRNLFSGSANSHAANYFVPYIGIGGLLGFGTNSDYFTRNGSDNSAFALQVPLGVEFLPGPQRFSVFAELAPSVEIAPQGAGFMTADLGARFYF